MKDETYFELDGCPECRGREPLVTDAEVEAAQRIIVRASDPLDWFTIGAALEAAKRAARRVVA